MTRPSKPERIVAEDIAEATWIRMRRLKSSALCKRMIGERWKDLPAATLDEKAEQSSRLHHLASSGGGSHHAVKAVAICAVVPKILDPCSLVCSIWPTAAYAARARSASAGSGGTVVLMP